MKTIIKATASGVTLIYNANPYGDAEIVTREFWVPAGGTYVREGDKQVCKQLKSSGSTLAATPETIEAVIRREYAAMRRAERAFSAANFQIKPTGRPVKMVGGKACNVFLDAASRAKAEKIGGSVSEGIRIALAAYSAKSHPNALGR